MGGGNVYEVVGGWGRSVLSCDETKCKSQELPRAALRQQLH